MTAPRTSEVEESLEGRRFGENGFLLIRQRIGRGGMGTVYRAWDTVGRRDVAAKFLRPGGFEDRHTLGRFIREGKRFGRLRHRNIVRVYALGKEQGHVYIASEFVDGENLLDFMKTHHPLPPRRAVEICRDVALGLAEAHRHDIVHRDLKPENVVIRRSDLVVKIVDFGIAKDLNESINLTRAGTFLGTPGYSAPEQIRNELVDHRADLFSLGVLLYETTTGLLPFAGTDTEDVIGRVLASDPASWPRRKLPSSELTELCERLLQAAPADRPASMPEVVAELDRYLADSTG